MDKIFRNTPKLTATDWLIDAVIAAGAFGFCCLQLTVAVNLLIPDEFMRRLMGIQAMVPSGLSLLAIALTTLPLVLRRKFPWAVFVWCLVSWGLLQAELNGIALSVAGPLIALFTLASARSRAEAAIACAVMCLVLLFAPAPPEQSRILTQLTVFQNMALALAAAFAGYALHEHRSAPAPSRSGRLPPAQPRRRGAPSGGGRARLHRPGGARHHGPFAVGC
ncbi:MAG: hypothetical protein ACLUE1_04695 [Adlercreutzia equolifaciens]